MRIRGELYSLTIEVGHTREALDLEVKHEKYNICLEVWSVVNDKYQ